MCNFTVAVPQKYGFLASPRLDGGMRERREGERRRVSRGARTSAYKFEQRPNKDTTNTEWEKSFPHLNQTHFTTT